MPFVPGLHGTPREITGPISANDTPLSAPSALLAAARDTALGRCVLLLLYIAPAAAAFCAATTAAATAASTGATAERVAIKTEQAFQDWAGSGPFVYKQNKNMKKNAKVHQYQ